MFYFYFVACFFNKLINRTKSLITTLMHWITALTVGWILERLHYLLWSCQLNRKIYIIIIIIIHKKPALMHTECAFRKLKRPFCFLVNFKCYILFLMFSCHLSRLREEWSVIALSFSRLHHSVSYPCAPPPTLRPTCVCVCVSVMDVCGLTFSEVSASTKKKGRLLV